MPNQLILFHLAGVVGLGLRAVNFFYGASHEFFLWGRASRTPTVAGTLGGMETIQYTAQDMIRRGDRVSWMGELDGHPTRRLFGAVTEVMDDGVSFKVREGRTRIHCTVPCTKITKEFPPWSIT
jgi:hypothetical protein